MFFDGGGVMGILQDLRKDWKKSRVRIPKGMDFKKEYQLIKEKKSMLPVSARKAIIMHIEGHTKSATAE